MTSHNVKVGVFLLLLCIQTGVALLFKLSQREGRYRFSTASAQTTAEVFKLCISASLFYRDTLNDRVASAAALPAGEEEAGEGKLPPAGPRGVLQAFRAQVDQRLLLHTAGLSALYCGNNQLAFALFRWADAATVTLIKSSSSIVSALLLWLLLDRPIATLQWHAIVLQVLG